MTDGCELCGDFPAVLVARCHPSAPLRLEKISPTEVIVRCYVPACNREVARLRLEPQRPPGRALAEGFGDPETLLNSRQWLREALEAKGAQQIGAGCGIGQADIDILLEGCRFNVSIRPLNP